jgi:hypothetical protein
MYLIEASANRVHRSLSGTAARFVVYDAIVDRRFISSNPAFTKLGYLLKSAAQAIETVTEIDRSYSVIEAKMVQDMLGEDQLTV